MDKKELQNLIDRISLTGPEGIKKAKKALREIVQNSEDTQKKAEEDIQKAQEQVSNDLLDDEYTIAQAINDLNERIEKLEVSGGAKPSHTLTILDASSENMDLSTALSLLKIDGKTPASIEDLFVFDTNSIIDAEELGYGTFLPSNISKFKEGNYIHFNILFGFTSNNFGKYGRVDISSSGDDNSVFVMEI